MIRTVLGDIKKEELGITMCHEHFIVDLTSVRKDTDSIIETVEEVIPEIAKMQELKVQSAIEVTTIDLKRDVRKLVEISKRTGLNIVASTGFYIRPYHPKFVDDSSSEEIADLFIKEINEGMDDTGIRAGIIAEIGSTKGFHPEEKKVHRAAAIAAVKTGAAVSTHTGPNEAMETIDILLSEGMNPDKVIIGHQDLVNDTNHHMNLLKRGVNIAFDTVGKTAYMSDDVRADNFCELIKQGFEDHILLSNDVSRRTYFTSYGELGYTAVMSKFIPMLKERGISDRVIEKVLFDNPARILDFDERD